MGLHKVVLMNSRSRMPVQMDAFLGAFFSMGNLNALKDEQL